VQTNDDFNGIFRLGPGIGVHLFGETLVATYFEYELYFDGEYIAVTRNTLNTSPGRLKNERRFTLIFQIGRINRVDCTLVRVLHEQTTNCTNR
jgi:hypothetical protein